MVGIFFLDLTSISYFSRMIKFAFAFFLVAISFGIQAQDTIVYFDRPGIGDGPYITQKGKINIESGLSYTTYFNEDFNFIPAAMARLQVAQSNELRLMYDYAPQSLLFIRDAVFLDYTYLSIGSKQRLGRTPDWFADAALISNVYYPVQSFSNFNSDQICFDTYLVFEHNASNGNYINYSLGYIYGGARRKDILQWSFAANFYVGKLMVFTEYFGFGHLNFLNFEHGLDAGVLFEFNENMQLDFSIIWNNFTNDLRMQNAVFYALGYSICIGK